MIQKNSQVNVLKTHLRVHKDRQEDIKNPRKVLEKISFPKLSSLHSKKNIHSTTELHDLRNTIEKSFHQKGCKLSSIKTIE